MWWKNTTNAHHHEGELYELALLRSIGHKSPWNPELHLCCKRPFNGGIQSNRLESHLEKGDKIFRFSDKKRAPEKNDVISGCWWFDQETCIYLWKISSSGEKFRDNARDAFGVLEEWGDMGNLVSGFLTSNFWCFKGVTATAEGSGKKIVGGMHGLDALQVFVPGGFKPEDFDDLRFCDLSGSRIFDLESAIRKRK